MRRIGQRFRFLVLCVLGISSLNILVGNHYQQNKDRSRLVISSALRDAGELAQHAPTRAELNKKWSDDYKPLATWLFHRYIQSPVNTQTTPKRLLKGLRELIAHHKLNYSKKMEVSLSRWSQTLVRWSKATKRESVNKRELLYEGERRYFEAVGYKKIGRGYDAYVLYLWSLSLLKDFILTHPSDSAVPEALFYLGSVQFDLRGIYSKKVRSNYFLALCEELYPDTIWARQAANLRRGELTNGAI